jgi:hypothetical protein
VECGKLTALEAARTAQVATINDLISQVRILEHKLQVQKESAERLRREMEATAQQAAQHEAEHAAEPVGREREIEEARAAATTQSAALLERLVAGLDVLEHLRDEAALTAATTAASAAASVGPDGDGDGGDHRPDRDVEAASSGSPRNTQYGVDASAEAGPEVGPRTDALVQDAPQSLHVAAVLAQASVLLYRGSAAADRERVIVGAHEIGDLANEAYTTDLRQDLHMHTTKSSSDGSGVLSGAADGALGEGYAAAMEELEDRQAQPLEDELQNELDKLQRQLAQCAAENAVLRQELSLASTLLCSLRGQPLYPPAGDESVSDLSTVPNAETRRRGFANMICEYCRRLWSLW